MLHQNAAGEPCALISNIQKYTIHDGPGIRTALFFTGCTLRCLWCSNPETIAPEPRLGVYPDKCLSLERCGLCVRVCPEKGAPLKFENGLLAGVEMTAACKDCYQCADVCPPRALKQWGQLMTVDEMLQVVVEDRSFYQKTGGGVTLNGGEVMVQWEIASELLEACHRAKIHTCVETALNCPTAHMLAVYRHTDLVIADIKHMDSGKHAAFCGAGNGQILENIIKTVELGKKLVLRTPVVPGFNNSEADIRAIGAFIRDRLQNKIVQYQLLPFRTLGTEKYRALGMPYPMADCEMPERAVWEAELLRLADILSGEYGITACAGSVNKLQL